MTIIIDGATTNEWATRDEYQRLIDSSQNPSGPSGSATSSNTAPVSVGAPEPAASGNAVNSLNGPRQGSPEPAAQATAPGQPLASASPTPTARSAASRQSFSNSQQQQQQQRETNDRQAAANLDELQLALDRLDLIEHERKDQLQQLNRLQVLEKMAESNVVFALTHGKTNAYTNNNNNNDEDGGFGAGQASRSQYLNQQQQQPQQLGAHSEGQLAPVSPDNRQPSVAAGGARTISDLVPFTDDDLEDPLRRLKERETPRKYCGGQLIDVLDLVCQGRYYVNEYEPKIVNPTIKSKRSIDYANSDIANDQLMMLDSSAASSSSSSSADAPGTLRGETKGLPGGSSSGTGGQVSSRRTKLRTLARSVTLGRPASHSNADSDGDRGDRSASFINNGESSLRANYDNGNNLDEPHNQQQQQQHYLSTIDIQNHNQNQNHNHNHYNNGGPNVRNRHSKMAQYRRIRGASKDCCDRSCYLEELKPYCSKP